MIGLPFEMKIVYGVIYWLCLSGRACGVIIFCDHTSSHGTEQRHYSASPLDTAYITVENRIVEVFFGKIICQPV
jgi:hypothetical protein